MDQESIPRAQIIAYAHGRKKATREEGDSLVVEQNLINVAKSAVISFVTHHVISTVRGIKCATNILISGLMTHVMLRTLVMLQTTANASCADREIY